MGTGTKVVLDTNVLISALGWPGPERYVYELCLQGEIQLCISRSILEELLRVLDYPKFRFPSGHKVMFVQGLLSLANLVEPRTVPDVVKEDPVDNHVLACAAAGEATFLITGDNHLLSLKSYGSTVICSAATFLRSYYRYPGNPVS